MKKNLTKEEKGKKLLMIEKVALAILSRSDIKPEINDAEIIDHLKLYQRIYALFEWEFLGE
jgi:hypothetical protein